MNKLDIKSPNYALIFLDIIMKNFPEKYDECKEFLNKSEFNFLDILVVNKKIFGKLSKETQKHRSYLESDILFILNFQKNNFLNNSQTAKYFDISRTSLSKWKKRYNYTT